MIGDEVIRAPGAFRADLDRQPALIEYTAVRINGFDDAGIRFA